MRPSGGIAGVLRLLVLLAIQVACSSGSDATCNLGEYFCMSCPEGSYQPSYLDGTTGFHIKGAENGAKAGHSVASAGDFDGDGGCRKDLFCFSPCCTLAKERGTTPLPSSSACKPVRSRDGWSTMGGRGDDHATADAVPCRDCLMPHSPVESRANPDVHYSLQVSTTLWLASCLEALGLLSGRAGSTSSVAMQR